MKTSYYLLIISVFILGTTGCEDDKDSNRVVGTGPIVTKNLEFSAFDKIENTGVANFYIAIGSPQTVVLKAQQNIIDVMTYEVVGQTLKVGVEDNVSLGNHEEIRFDITVPSITNIGLIGVGNYILSGDDQDELTINLIGVGNVDAYDMKVGTCIINSIGVGDCKVHVLNELTVTITGVGNVYYKGTPSITSSVTGLGQLINAN